MNLAVCRCVPFCDRPGARFIRSNSFPIVSATMFSKRVPGQSTFFTEWFCSEPNRADVCFWRSTRGPINLKQLFSNRFGSDAFRTSSDRSSFVHRLVLFKTDVCFFVISPGPTNPKQHFPIRFGNDALEKGSWPELFFHKPVVFKTDVCF